MCLMSLVKIVDYLAMLGERCASIFMCLFNYYISYHAGIWASSIYRMPMDNFCNLLMTGDTAT